jgi:hypothetical protein
MFIKKYFNARHEILKVLANYQDSFPVDTPSVDRMLHFSEITNKLKHYDKDFFLDNLQYLTDTKEIHCTRKFDNSEFIILKEGRTSYRENKYKNLGSKFFRDNLFDTLKIISTTLLLLITVYTFIYNIYQTGRNKEDIRLLNEELKTLKEAVILKTK